MEYLLIVLAVAIAIVALSALKNRFLGFSAQSPDDYAGETPVLDIRQHLNGAMVCEGLIYGPTGRVSARFVADMNASWNGDTCHMTEDFYYDGGTTQHRHWDLTVDDQGNIHAKAPDIVGTGKGKQSGSAVQLKYRIRLPESSGGHVLDVTDWMYLTESGSIVNRSQFRKFGILTAELVATIRVRSDQVAMAAQ